MADAGIVRLANEVTADLEKKSGSWSVPFIPERAYFPVANLEDLDTLKVHVSTAGWSKQPASRSQWAHDYVIEIGLQFQPKATAGAEAKTKFDALMKTLEEIGDHYESTRPTLADCVLTAVEYGPGGSGQPYVPMAINDKNLFVGVIRLTFRKWR